MEYTNQKSVSDILKIIFSPTLLLLGLIGNIISIVIFSQKSMQKHTTFRYLSLLSVVDICALYVGFSQILFSVYFDIDIRLISEASCKIQSFLVYFFTHFSSILLTTMSIDRTISITLKLNNYSTPRTAVKFFILIGIVIFVFDSHLLFYTHLYEIKLPMDVHNDSADYLNECLSNLAGNNCTIRTNFTIKTCYAYINSSYFHWLVKYFPW
jgi:hypothetical protein